MINGIIKTAALTPDIRVGDVKGNLKNEIFVRINTDGKVRYTVPQVITEIKDTDVYFRVSDIYKNVKICVYRNDEAVMTVRKIKVAPGEMEKIKIKKEFLDNTSELTVKIEECDL